MNEVRGPQATAQFGLNHRLHRVVEEESGFLCSEAVIHEIFGNRILQVIWTMNPRNLPKFWPFFVSCFAGDDYSDEFLFRRRFNFHTDAVPLKLDGLIPHIPG